MSIKLFWRTLDTSFAEFQSAMMSFVMGAFFIAAHESQATLWLFQPMLGQMPAASWGTLFILFGATQAIARLYAPRVRRKLVSFIAFVFWLYVGALCLIQTPTPIISTFPLLLAGLNMVVYYRLATWRRDDD